MENVLQFAKQNEAFLWRFLIVIVFVIVLLNLYLRQRLKINKELKKLEGEREFYNSIFLEEDSFYIHIDEAVLYFSDRKTYRNIRSYR